MNITSRIVQFQYDMEVPGVPTAAGTNGETQRCASNTVDIKTSGMPVYSGAALYTGMVEWEYSLDGDNGPNGWESLPGYYGDVQSLSFNRLNEIPDFKTGTHTIRFRARNRARFFDGEVEMNYRSAFSGASTSITIFPSPPTLQDTSYIVKTSPCPNGSDGSIYIAPQYLQNIVNSQYRWVLRPGDEPGTCVPDDGNCGHIVAQSQAAVSSSNPINITGLDAGQYTLWLLNGSGSSGNCFTSYKVTIPPMANISVASAGSGNISCYGAGDGVIKALATGGKGRATGYTYVLYSGTNIVNILTGNNDPVSFTNLQPGAYWVEAFSNGCTYRVSFSSTLTQPPLLQGNVTQKQPSCAASGNYTATLRNQDVTCTDAFTQVIEIYQRPQLHVSLQATDVTCKGDANGKLSATFGGGSGTYRFTWQKFVNGNWVTDDYWFDYDTEIEELGPGTYRVILSDGKATCSVTSEEIKVNEPDLLVISKVMVTDAVCFEDGGSIDISTTGGNGNLTYSYLFNNETDYTAYIPTSAIHTRGEYQLRAIDNKGCTATDPTRYPLTLPDSPLILSHQLSDYHGLNISCTGNTDGSVTFGGGDGRFTSRWEATGAQATAIFRNLPAEGSISQ